MQATALGIQAKTGLDPTWQPFTHRKPQMEPDRPPHTSKSLEDVVLKFIEKNNRAIWAVILAIALAVIYGVNAN